MTQKVSRNGTRTRASRSDRAEYYSFSHSLYRQAKKNPILALLAVFVAGMISILVIATLANRPTPSSADAAFYVRGLDDIQEQIASDCPRATFFFLFRKDRSQADLAKCVAGLATRRAGILAEVPPNMLAEVAFQAKEIAPSFTKYLSPDLQRAQALSSSADITGRFKTVKTSEGPRGGEIQYAVVEADGTSHQLFLSSRATVIPPEGTFVTIPKADAKVVKDGVAANPYTTNPLVPVREALANFSSTGNIKIALVPVYAGNTAPATPDLASTASQIESFYNSQAGGKATFSVEVKPAVKASYGTACDIGSTIARGASATQAIAGVTGFNYKLAVITGTICGTATGSVDAAAVNYGNHVATYIHELGHLLGLGHLDGANVTNDPMSGGVPDGGAGSFTIVHKHILKWTNPYPLRSVGVGVQTFNGSEDGVIVTGGCSGNNLFVDRSMRLFCQVNIPKEGGVVDSKYMGTVSSPAPGLSATLSAKGSNSFEVLSVTGGGAEPGTGTDPTVPGSTIVIPKLGSYGIVCNPSTVQTAAGRGFSVAVSVLGDSRVSTLLSVNTRQYPGFPASSPGISVDPTVPAVSAMGGQTVMLPVGVGRDASGNLTAIVQGSVTYYVADTTGAVVGSRGQTIDQGGEPKGVTVYFYCSVGVQITSPFIPGPQDGGQEVQMYVNGNISDFRVNKGTSVSLTWKGTNGPCSVTATPALSINEPNKMLQTDASKNTFVINQDTVFAIQCARARSAVAVRISGTGVTSNVSARLQVLSTNIIESREINKDITVAVGSNVDVRWTASNASGGCGVTNNVNDNVWTSGPNVPSGSATMTNVRGPITLTLRCKDGLQQASDSAQVSVKGVSTGGASDTSISCTPIKDRVNAYNADFAEYAVTLSGPVSGPVSITGALAPEETYKDVWGRELSFPTSTITPPARSVNYRVNRNGEIPQSGKHPGGAGIRITAGSLGYCTVSLYLGQGLGRPGAFSADVKVNGSDTPPDVASGTTVRFSWTSANVDQCDWTASSLGGFGLPNEDSLARTFGYVDARITRNTTFTLTCKNGGQSTTDSITQHVINDNTNPADSPGIDPEVILNGICLNAKAQLRVDPTNFYWRQIWDDQCAASGIDPSGVPANPSQPPTQGGGGNWFTNLFN